MKVRISRDEWWPVYSIETERLPNADCLDIDRKLVAGYKRADAKFGEMQRELAALYEEQEAE